MNEAQFIEKQSNDARAAIVATARAAGRDVLDIASPRTWVNRHPWKSVALAAAAGFVAVDVLRKRPEEQAPSETASEPPKPPFRPVRFLLLVLLRARRLVKFITPIVEGILVAATAYEPDSDGHHTPPTPASAAPPQSQRP